PPGGSDTLRVRFDARQYKDGDYAGEVRIASNDVEEPQLAVPCAMHVGLLRDPAQPQPAGFDAVSITPLVHFVLSPPTPGAGLVEGSLRVDGLPLRLALEPRPAPGGNLDLAVRSVDVLARTDGATTGRFTLTGEYDADGWFSADAPLTVTHPSLTGGPLPAFE